jgi:hypothetical protein
MGDQRGLGINYWFSKATDSSLIMCGVKDRNDTKKYMQHPNIEKSGNFLKGSLTRDFEMTATGY